MELPRRTLLKMHANTPMPYNLIFQNFQKNTDPIDPQLVMKSSSSKFDLEVSFAMSAGLPNLTNKIYDKLFFSINMVYMWDIYTLKTLLFI